MTNSPSKSVMFRVADRSPDSISDSIRGDGGVVVQQGGQLWAGEPRDGLVVMPGPSASHTALPDLS